MSPLKEMIVHEIEKYRYRGADVDDVFSYILERFFTRQICEKYRCKVASLNQYVLINARKILLEFYRARKRDRLRTMARFEWLGRKED